MNDKLRRLRDAILRRDREVEVDANGTVREIPQHENNTEEEKARPTQRRATKLAPRTFGGVAQMIDGELPADDSLGDVEAALKPRSHVCFFVPSLDRYGRPLDHLAFIRATEDALLPIAGGTTTGKRRGRWRGATGIYIDEAIGLVHVFLPKVLTRKDVETILSEIVRIGQEGDQETVAIIVDGRPFVISTASFSERAG